MDEREVEAMLDRLAARGIVEEVDGHLRTTREWNRRLRLAGEELNLEVGRTGREPAGNPLDLAVRLALAAEGFGPRDLDVAAHVVVLLELDRMTPDERVKLGFRREPPA